MVQGTRYKAHRVRRSFSEGGRHKKGTSKNGIRAQVCEVTSLLHRSNISVVSKKDKKNIDFLAPYG